MSSPHTSPEHVETLQAFTSLLKIRGRPFGQKGKPVFGISDGKKVQWNLEIWLDTGDIILGVNLEGSCKTGGWLIAPFILSELENPAIETLKTKVNINPSDIIFRFSRDAWRKASRLSIVENYLGGKKFSLSEIDTTLWQSILQEALACLNKDKGYRGRALQEVTEILNNGHKKPKQLQEVSPHLTIQIKIENDEDIISNLQRGFDKLRPVYNWVNDKCGVNA